jgi:acyl carrier protein
MLHHYLAAYDGSRLSDSDSVMQNSVMDSTAILELIAFSEEKFGIRIAEQNMTPRKLDTVDSITSFLARMPRPAT